MTVTLIAELGSNHDGSLGQAMALARAAIEAGADIVKLQDHRWQDIAPDAKHPPWMPEQAVAVESRADYIYRTCLDAREWKLLSSYVRLEFGAKFMVSPFSVQALEWHLEHGTLDAVKIASGQAGNRALLERCHAIPRSPGALTGIQMPIYVSTGMSSWQEKSVALTTLSHGGHPIPSGASRREGITWMACTSAYPCRPEDTGLRELSGDAMSEEGVNPGIGVWHWGYSDHTLGHAASLAAVTLGASAIERHVGWDRRAYGSDAGHSMTIDEFAAFVVQVRELERMLSGKSKDEIVAGLGETRKAFLYDREEPRRYGRFHGLTPEGAIDWDDAYSDGSDTPSVPKR
jgi:N,N'-diacetyllegionaminate synthase